MMLLFPCAILILWMRSHLFELSLTIYMLSGISIRLLVFWTARKILMQIFLRGLVSQVTLLSAVRHDNLVPLLGYCCENDQQILVYPFMSNGSLQDRLYGNQHYLKHNNVWLFKFLISFPFHFNGNSRFSQGKHQKGKCWTGQPDSLLHLVLLEASLLFIYFIFLLWDQFL